MFDPTAQGARPWAALAPKVLNQSADQGTPRGVGAFQLSSYYSGGESTLSRRQFTGKANLKLQDPLDGEAAVAMGDVGPLSLAYVRSTGHEVALSELYKPNLLVPVTGTLASRNEHMLFEHHNQPWVMFGRGMRETTVFAEKDFPYQAFVLSMPPNLLGDRLTRLEARGGMIWATAPKEDDVFLARLTLALATKLSLSKKMSGNAEVAEAWKTIILDRVKHCLDACLHETDPEKAAEVDSSSLIHVRRAEALFHERLNEIRNLGDIAVHVGVSERTLQSAFRKLRGATPMQVLTQLRLDRARLMLLDREGPNTVSEVCELCGFEHHGRFSARYKMAYGESPIVTLKSRTEG